MISEAACLHLNRRSPVLEHSFETTLGEMGLRQVLGHIGQAESGQRRANHLARRIKDELALDVHF